MSKIIEALRSAVEHRERISLDDIDCANLLAVIDVLKVQQPVAWALLGLAVTQSEAEAARWEHQGLHVTPLYAAPKPGDKGIAAWADVPNATEWLEDLRGNEAAPGDPT